MKSLRHYFCSAPSAPSASSTSSGPSIHLEYRSRKRPVGRPPKKVVKKTEKLVEYSSTDSEATDSEAQNETPLPTKKRLRRMYSRGQKSKVAHHARHHGIRNASREFGVHHKNVQRWMKDQVATVKNPGKRANKKGQGRKITYPQELEDKLLAWIMEKREAECVAISTQVIRLKALSLIKASNPEFKASDGWVRKFMKRNDLVLRVRTHISQNLPKDLEEKIRVFRTEVKKN